MRVIVIGGLGNFGARICQRLSKVPGLTVIAACRKPESRTHTFAFGQIVSTLALDIHSADFEIRLIEAAPRLVIHCAGPFQGQDYRVALASCAAGAHYMDLADGRDFVANFAAQVDASAKAAGVLAVSGASSVPGLSSAVVDHLSKSLLRVNSISIVGNVPEIPCMATVLLACKLADGELELTGAFPCMGLLKLEEFDAEFQRWDITSEIAEEIL